MKRGHRSTRATRHGTCVTEYLKLKLRIADSWVTERVNAWARIRRVQRIARRWEERNGLRFESYRKRKLQIPHSS
jgi:hypothetical protein